MKDARLTKEVVSSTEACGFVTYFLCIPCALVSFVWSVMPDQNLQNVDISYYPPKTLAITLPAFTILLFTSIPVAYTLMNHFSSRPHTSRDILWDGHSREFSISSNSHNKSNVPEVCDLDVSLINYSMSKTVT